MTTTEFQTLFANWQRVAGRRGRWKAVGLSVAAILLWTLVSQILELPNWADQIIVILAVVGLSCWFLSASLAPRRLVNGRPDVAPPRSMSQARSEARAVLSWQGIVLVLLASGAIFIGHLRFPDDSLDWWAWMLGSGVMFGLYVWIAIQKLRDR